MDRRTFLGASLTAGYALAAGPARADAIHTSADGLIAGDIQFTSGDEQVPAYRARPAVAGTFPIVLVIEEIFGVHEYIKDICRRFAHEGYCAIAPELFARTFDPSKMTDIQEILKNVARVPDAPMMADLDAAAEFALSDGGDPKRLFVTGFCRGGRATWLYAAHQQPASLHLRAAVAWYGPVGGDRTDIQPHTASDLASNVRVPILGLYGARDQSIPPADVRAAIDRVRARGIAAELVVYPDAGHAFHADYRPSFVAAAASDGWTKCLDWFRAHGA